MSSTLSKWLTGCGVGCGLVVLAAVGITTAGYMYVKSRFQSFEEAKTTSSELRSTYGEITDFCPEPDGVVRPDRVKAFLAIREKLAPARRTLESSMRNLSEDIRTANSGQNSFPQVLGLISQGFGIIPQLGEFHATRVRSLREGGMSPGEYVYLYVVSYYSFLSKSPADGPDFKTGGRDGFRVGSGAEHGGRHISSAERAHNMLLPMLRNQRAALARGRAEAVRDSWADTLDSEIRAMESNGSRIPWSDGLPKVLKESLEPFRAVLERSYDRIVNPLELEFWDREPGQHRPFPPVEKE